MATIVPTSAPLIVRDAGPGKGRGVFATDTIAPGTLLEVCPVLVLGREEYETHGAHTVLAHYTFVWPGGGQAVCLGLCGSMWNHSKRPNVGFVCDPTHSVIRFTAIRQIKSGEECCISYGSKLWFPVVDDGGDCSSSELSDDLEAALSGIVCESDEESAT